MPTLTEIKGRAPSPLEVFQSQMSRLLNTILGQLPTEDLEVRKPNWPPAIGAPEEN